MTKYDPIKKRTRNRIEVTREDYAKARRLMTAYPEPTPEAIAAADALDKTYDPARVSLDDRLAAAALMGGVLGIEAPGGAGPDTYQHSVPGFFGEKQERTKPEGEIALIARPETHQGQPALALECVGVTQPHDKMPGAWLTCLGLDLEDRGFKYDSVGGSTARWRVELAPDADDHSQPVGVRVHDGAGWTLFDGKALLPPGWIVRAQIDPVGLLVVVGPLTDDIPFPEHFYDDLDELFGYGAVIAARMLVDVKPRRQADQDAPEEADGNPFGSWAFGRVEPGGQIPLDILVQSAIVGCVDDGITEHGESLFETLDDIGITGWRQAGALLVRFLLGIESFGRGPEAADRFLESLPALREDMPAHMTWNLAFAAGLREGADAADAVLNDAEDNVLKGAVKFMFTTAVAASGFPRSEHDVLMGRLLAGVR